MSKIHAYFHNINRRRETAQILWNTSYTFSSRHNPGEIEAGHPTLARISAVSSCAPSSLQFHLCAHLQKFFNFKNFKNKKKFHFSPVTGSL